MRSEKNISIATLGNGMKLACTRIPGARVEYWGVVVKAGSRDDGNSTPGLAHFVEHTLFKGTERRSSWHIINRMERVGGELNAYTTKEETVVYAAAPSGNGRRAIELIADLVINSRFPKVQLDKEREVVADEINSYLDSPSEAVYDDFEEYIFAGTPLAHNILGDLNSLASFNSETCRDYLRKWYAADNMSFFYSGPCSEEKVARLVEAYFQELPHHCFGHEQQELLPLAHPFHISKKIDSHQAHTVMGARTQGMFGKNRYALALVTNILGGPGMNSRLNVSLREKRGYVYSVEAMTSMFTDSGEFCIYYGCDPEDVEKCMNLAVQEVEALATKPLSQTALSMAKKQYLGQLAVASDSRENSSISTGRAALYFGSILSPKQVEERINDVSSANILDCAASLLPLSSLTLA